MHRAGTRIGAIRRQLVETARPWLARLRTALRPELIIAGFVLAALAYKIRLMWHAAVGPIVVAIVQHDAPVLAAMLLFALSGLWAAQRAKAASAARRTWQAVSKLSLAAGLGIVLVFAADVFAYYFFATRLYASDLVTFSSELSAALSLLRAGSSIAAGFPLWKLAGVAAVAGVLLHACYALVRAPAGIIAPVRKRALALAAAGLLAFYAVPLPSYVYSFGDKPLFENFVERNANFFVHSNFSEPFSARLLAAPQPAQTCFAGSGRRLNIVLVIVESLSAYHSQFFSGIESWTPRLDAIARRETALTNFHANGWTTIGGLISLLGHTFPFVPEHTEFNQWGSPRLTDFLDVPRPLPRMMAEKGYATTFLAAGDLRFLGQGDWLHAIGFQKLIERTDPRFGEVKVRGPFDSVPDKQLYDVALQEMAAMPAGKPYFMVVQTYWSHRPFMAPDGGNVSGEEPVIREADIQLGRLYDRLSQSGFFDNGLLLITGDHRAMEPFRKAEIDRFGASASSRIPGVIVTRALKLPHVIGDTHQQRDVAASLEALTGERYCRGPYEGAFLGDAPSPPRCIMHARGDDRDLVYVKCGAKEATVRVAGDKTRVVAGAIDDEASVIHTINATRLRPRARPAPAQAQYSAPAAPLVRPQ